MKKLKWQEQRGSLVADGAEVGRFEIHVKKYSSHLSLFEPPNAEGVEKCVYIGKYADNEAAKAGAQEHWDLADPPGKLQGLPMCLRIKPEDDKERRQWWIDHPPRPMFEAPKISRPQCDYKAAERITERERAKLEAGDEPERSARKPRASRDGLVSVGDIAKDLGIDAKEARGFLRASKLPKPDCGWAWPSGEVEGVKKKILAEKEKSDAKRSGNGKANSDRSAARAAGSVDQGADTKGASKKRGGDVKPDLPRPRKVGGKSSDRKKKR